MQQYLLSSQGCTLAPNATPNTSAQWLRFTASEAEDSQDFISTVQQLSGISLHALHAKDATNLLHPSHYDAGAGYDTVIFRSLLPMRLDLPIIAGKKRRHKLHVIATQPITFFIADNILVTVQHSEQIDLMAYIERLKLISQTNNTISNNISNNVNNIDNKSIDLLNKTIVSHITPHQLFLRFINAQVDAYLALRQPLTDQLDHWQRELLDPRRAFNDWTALLDARLELRKLEALSEEQMDALSELREAWLDNLPYDATECTHLRVRLADICEHIERVLNHAKRLESSVESAIQLHFAAVAHQTNHTVRNLTVLTGVFAPLSLITGFYGMNVPLPWQQHPQAVWWIILGMILSAISILGGMWLTRWLRVRAGRTV